MTFSELYGEQLNIELGSDDTTKLFTTARRKAAINAGQREFARATSCYVLEHSEDLTDEQQEYDLQTLVASNKFLKFASRQPYLMLDDGTNVTYIDAASFPRLDVEELDRSYPGWRQAGPGIPEGWYLRRVDDKVYLGLYPAPDIPSGSTWTIVIPYAAYPADMSADGDIPFEDSISLQAYHLGIVHYAAARLERLRRNRNGSEAQMEDFRYWIAVYEEDQHHSGGERVQFAHDYFSAAGGGDFRARDPRRWP